MFSPDDRQRLLSIGRQALDARVRRLPEPLADGGGALDLPCGAFVSVHLADELRGCLGRLECDWPIWRVVAHLGRAVADSDPRFAPLAIHELEEVALEISALGRDREMRDLTEIEIGRHGLIVEEGRRRGLLLPQVAPAHGWDAERFLQHTCVKAGLAPDAWYRGAEVRIFEAEVFGEHDARPVERVG